MDTSVKPCLVARAIAWDVGADMEIKVPAPKIAAFSTICVVFLNIACSGLRRLGWSCVVVPALRYRVDHRVWCPLTGGRRTGPNSCRLGRGALPALCVSPLPPSAASEGTHFPQFRVIASIPSTLKKKTGNSFKKIRQSQR
jgi:hypothetical protein